MNLDGELETGAPAFDELDLPSKWIMSRANKMIANVQGLFDSYLYGEAGNRILSFMWDEFAPWYLEIAKHALYGEDETAKTTTRRVMVSVLDTCLRLLHPYMPFMTEEAWNYIPHDGEALIIAKWPESNPAYIDDEAEAEMNLLMDMVRAIREIRTEYKVSPGKRISAIIAPGKQGANIEQYAYVFARLCNVEKVDLLDDKATAPENSASSVVSDTTIYLPLEGMLDTEKECARLKKEQEKTMGAIKGTEAKLANENFVNKAPEHVVQVERDRLAELQSEIKKIEELLNSLCS